MHALNATFRLPPNLHGKIWQYMELAQFVSMLHRKALFFVKARKLRDPYEGIIPQFNNLTMSAVYDEEEQETKIHKQSNDFAKIEPQSMRRQFELYRELVLINGWHSNEYESAAMWHLYAHENAGIAIQSTIGKLSNSFKNNHRDTIWIGQIQYLDFSKDWVNEWNDVFQAFLIKRKSFEYENEIRAVTCLPDHHHHSGKDVLDAVDEEKVRSPKSIVANPEEMTDKGKYVSADLQTLIENIYIAPYAESWFKEVIESLLSKYQLKAKVIKSDLYTIL
jgi:Protein of unknown function (DUF2971)